MSGWAIIIVALAYVTLLFAVASYGDRKAAARGENHSRPYIYALSVAIFCTSWTFFGSVGLAAERGFEFLAVYIGPAIIFLFGTPFLRHIIRLSKSEKITSVADFLAARYGKSFAVASIATIIATVGTVPYIALQLKAISDSVGLMVTHYSAAPPVADFIIGDVSLTVALMLAVFAVLFGTRHADATEHQDGMVLAVALESLVKLAAFLAIGIAVTFFLFGPPETLFTVTGGNSAAENAISHQTPLSRWIVLMVLSGLAIIMLPRQFHVMIVENRTEAELKTASWLFPLYLLLINLFVLPIALTGLSQIGDRTSADLYVLALPLFSGQDLLATLTFIGGLSAATAMVIVASVALSIMISNDLIIPLIIRRNLRPDLGENEDWSKTILNIRRTAIFLILLAAFLYYRETANNFRLASIGLLSFAAIAQFAPALLGGLLWRRANARGAIAGMCAGFAMWAYTLLLPSLLPDSGFVSNGLFGLPALRPQTLFGIGGDALTHGVLWSLAINTLIYVLASLSRVSSPLERIQATIFVPRDSNPMPSLKGFHARVSTKELKETISRYLGAERTERSFRSFEQKKGTSIELDSPASMETIRLSEQLLASAVGSSSARLILSLLFQRNDSSDLHAFRLLDDASEALQQNRDLLQIALDQMEQGITVLDEDYRLTCWNRKYRSLFDLPDEMGQVGISMAQVLDHLARRGDIAPGAEPGFMDRLSDFGAAWQLELQSSGKVIEIRSNPMPDGGIVATYADITTQVHSDLELKRANETLEQRVADRTAELTRVNRELEQAQIIADEANLGKTRFLAAAGHDILQPLNAARLYCTALMEKTSIEDSVQSARNIDSALESVETILGAVLDISRLDTGAMKPNRTVFKIGDLLQQIETDFTPIAAKKGLRLQVIPSSLILNTDRNLLRRLVQNLVSNAIKYTRQGRILVGVRRRGNLAELQVFDTGIGIHESNTHTVFREFTRLDEGIREADGLGLGLSIVDRIARVLELEIRMSSMEKAGSRFSVIIPTTNVQTLAPAPNERPAETRRFSLNGLSILCIDNEPRITDGMRQLLEGWGCRVRTMSGSHEISQSTGLFDDVPDVILADYHLDLGENGLDLVQSLRERYGAQIPAVLITADRTIEVRNTAAELDIPVISKPIKPAALRSALRHYHSVLPAAE